MYIMNVCSIDVTWAWLGYSHFSLGKCNVSGVWCQPFFKLCNLLEMISKEASVTIELLK